jgi:hypothetical protein
MKIGFCSATILSGSTALPFVISTGAKRSGEISVRMLFLGMFSTAKEDETGACDGVLSAISIVIPYLIRVISWNSSSDNFTNVAHMLGIPPPGGGPLPFLITFGLAGLNLTFCLLTTRREALTVIDHLIEFPRVRLRQLKSQRKRG